MNNYQLYRLEKIATYYDGLQKEAAIGTIALATMRLAPKLIGLASKVKWLKPAIGAAGRFLGRTGARLSATGQFGKGIVEGLKGSSIHAPAVMKTMAGKGLQTLKGSAGTGRMGAIGITKGDIAKRLWGRKLGHFANVNTWSPYNKGLMIDAPLWVAAGNMLSGNTNEATAAYDTGNASHDAYLNGQYYGDHRNYNQYF